MIPIKKIMKKDFSRLSSSQSVGSAVKVMEKMDIDYLLIEEEGEIKGMVTSRELVGYPSSRLILDCVIQPIGILSEEALADEALKALKQKAVTFLLVLSKDGKPVGVINQEIIINSLFQQLRKLNKEKDRDITERKQAEEQLSNTYTELKETHIELLQAGKMAAMGEMAAGVAHELTQPLLGIKGFTTAMLEDVKSHLPTETSTVSDIQAWREQVVEDLEVILQQTVRMTTIVNNVRQFARESGTEMALLDINKPIEDALVLFSEQLRLHNIVVEKNLSSLPRVRGNANQMQGVFINLITNARDAIDAKGNKGQLMITTGVRPGGIYAEIEDTGIGADAETMSKMFEPFFTTKNKDKSIGLGLSIVAGIVEEHGGTIDVQGEPGRGCKFTITLPLRTEKEGSDNG